MPPEQQTAETDDDFESAFAEFSADEPESHQLSEEIDVDEEVEEETDQPSGSEEESPWQGLSEDQLEAIRRLEQERDDYRHRSQSDSGRISALQRKLNELEAAKEEPEPRQQASEQSADDGDDDWKEMLETVPDLAAAFDKRIAAREKALRDELLAAQKPLQDTIEKMTEQEKRDHWERQLQIVTEKAPEWMDTVRTPEWSKFLDTLPEPVRAMAEGNSADEFLYVYDTYKSRTAKPTADENSEAADIHQQRRQRLTQAQEPDKSKGGTGKKISEDDFDAAFSAFAARHKR